MDKVIVLYSETIHFEILVHTVFFGSEPFEDHECHVGVFIGNVRYLHFVDVIRWNQQQGGGGASIHHCGLHISENSVFDDQTLDVIKRHEYITLDEFISIEGAVLKQELPVKGNDIDELSNSLVIIQELGILDVNVLDKRVFRIVSNHHILLQRSMPEIINELTVFEINHVRSYEHQLLVGSTVLDTDSPHLEVLLLCVVVSDESIY